MTRSSSFVPGLVLAAVAATAWLAWPREGAVVPTEQGGGGVVSQPKQAPNVAAPAVGETAPKAAKPAPVAATTPVLKFPDGSTAPMLNGVKESVELVWNKGPYSPIKEKIVDHGLEWYVHEDGSHSTVQMVEVNGVPAPIGIVATPTEALPTFEQLQESLKQQLGGGK
ncbi:MAG: hypothetical protein RL398_899 [Planctomycetota bacterium]